MTTDTVYIGVDMAKDTFDAHLPTGIRQWRNVPAGFRPFLLAVRKIEGQICVCVEATGGYERTLCDYLMAHGVTVARVNPKRVRDFARALGKLAKTDRIDAATLSEYGSHIRPRPLEIEPVYQRRLVALIRRRDQINDLITVEANRLGQCNDAWVRKSLECSRRSLERLRARVEGELDALATEHAELAQRQERLATVAGVGTGTARAVLAYVPELGTLTRNEATALVGVAPFNRDSGKFKGQRTILGGRPEARRHLYMAALVAAHRNHILRPFYQHLVKTGKPKKLALTAVMRKLVIVLNQLLSNPGFVPSPALA